MAIPKLKKFREIVTQKRGNLTRVAEFFSVDRRTIYEWTKNNPEFKQVIDDARSRLFDECLTTAEVVAVGIPQRDEKSRFTGWIERPDGNMLRYLMSTLGRKEGFGESIDLTTNGKDINGVQYLFANVPLNEKEMNEIKTIINGNTTEKDSTDSSISET